MTIRVAVNDFISLRGMSGSDRAASGLVEALGVRGMHVERLRPEGLTDGSMSRAAQMWWWDHVGFRRQAVAMGADISINPANSGRGTSPSVLVMLDTMVLDHPALYDPRFVAYARVTYGRAVASADAIVTISEHSARRIRSRWNPTVPIHVIPLPASDGVVYDAPHDGVDGPPFVLVVASSDKHKRLPLAVECVAMARRVRPNLQLVVVTRRGNDSEQLSMTLHRLDPRSAWTSVRHGVPDDELALLYATAESLLVTSLDEGYCLPALEAIANRTPVVHAGLGALPELVPQMDRMGGTESEWLADRLVAMGEHATRGHVVTRGQPALARATTSHYSQAWTEVIAGLL